MKFLKGFLFAVTGLFILVTAVSLLMPSRVMTVRSVVIHGTNADVFKYVSDLQQWKRWHPVFMQDSNSIQITQPSNVENASASWETDGKKNKLQLITIGPSHIKIDLMRTGENTSENIISITALQDSNNVQAEWRSLTKLKWYPWEKFSGIFVDNMTGPGYEAALNNLKNLVESNLNTRKGN